MSAQYREIISEPEFFRAAYPMVVLASVFMVVRIGVQVRIRVLELQDYLIYLAFAFFLAMSICYLIAISTIFDISKVLVGLLEPWPTYQLDFLRNVRIVFITTVLFWLTLWSVKLSLLALYKKLLQGLPRVWTRLWWATFTFCIISLLGCIASYFTACPDFAAFILRGDCPNTPRNVRAQLASLYMSYAVDILSDLMIMFLPIRLVWNLQMLRAQKAAVITLFASGFVCIAFATLRVAQIGTKAGENTSPSPTWLAFWTIIESAVAICIGCCPAFAIFFRRAHTPHISYDTNGYVRHNRSQSGADTNNPGSIKMDAVTISSSSKRTLRRNKYWDDLWDSQEELAAESRHITVTTTLQQDHLRSDLNDVTNRDEASPDWLPSEKEYNTHRETNIQLASDPSEPIKVSST